MTITLKLQPPEEAVKAFEARGLLVTGSWQSLWQEEHARAFTVANLARLDLLQEIHAAIGEAIKNGQDYRAFAKGLVPKLQAAGWWAQEVPEGKPLAPSRLQLIYDTNLRVSYAAANWDRIERLKKTYPYLRYNTRRDLRVRPLHRLWEGIVLPVDHPFWDTHYPPNGWRCRCDVLQLSANDLKALGLEVTPDSALPTGQKTFTNRMTGEKTTVPEGIDPGWAYNPGKVGSAARGATVGSKLLAADPGAASRVAQAAGEAFTAPLKAQLGQWAEALQAGTLKPTGNQLVVGVLRSETLDFLAAAGTAPETAALTLSDREFLHMLRPAKADRGAAWSLPRLLDLPNLLAQPESVYWDTQDQVLVYAWSVQGQAAKAVIRVNYRVKSEGQKIRTNLIKTTGMVQPSDLQASRYQKIP